MSDLSSPDPQKYNTSAPTAGAATEYGQKSESVRAISVVHRIIVFVGIIILELMLME